MSKVFKDDKSAGVLDYVAAWYKLAAEYMVRYQPEESSLPKTRVAFVSTNSICQGEQVSSLWGVLFNQTHCKIHFAHKTFRWSNEAKGVAAVHVIIVGFSNVDSTKKYIFEYDTINSEPNVNQVKNISPYLTEGKDFFLSSLNKPICIVPQMKRGNSPYDGGNFLFTQEEKELFLKKEASAESMFKKFLGAKEFINNKPKWCLWLKDIQPHILKNHPLVLERINKVKQFRENSPGKETQAYAKTPSLFRDLNNPNSFIVIPRVSSENRRYIPNGFFNSDYIAGDTCMTVMDAGTFHFGVLTSEMHMSWVSYTCGRLESRYRYSKDIVYNNYPWPEAPTEKQKQAVEEAAQAVLDARSQFPESSLADLYDPNTMPPVLVKAHQQLDKAVDLCYRPQPFTSEAKRIEYLFELYEKYTGGLFQPEKKGKKKKDIQVQ
jgi:hypothetical protein